MNATNERNESHNPYAAPQAQLDAPTTPVIYINKLNAKVAFWTALAIDFVLLFFFYLPEVRTDRTIPRTTNDYIFACITFTAISVFVGLCAGKQWGTPIIQDEPESEVEK